MTLKKSYLDSHRTSSKKYSKKGTIIIDVGVPRELVEIIADHWKVVTIKDQDKALSDTDLQKKYGKGTFCLFTQDLKAHNYYCKDGVVGYIDYKVHSLDKFDELKAKVWEFMKNTNVRNLKKCKHTFTTNSDIPEKTKLPEY